MPAGDEAVLHVRVGIREPLGDRPVLALEHQNRAIDGIGECSANDKLTSLGSCPSMLQVLGPKFGPTLQIARASLVEEQEMPHSGWIPADGAPVLSDA